MTSPADRVAQRVRILLDLGRNAEAGRAAQDGLRDDPANAVLMGLLAFSLQADGIFDEARAWAERSLAVDPHQAWVHGVRARALLDGAGSPREAAESAYTAVQLDNLEPRYRYTLVRAHLECKRRSDAQAVAESIRTVAPGSALGPLALAMVELERARFFRIRPVWAVVLTVLTRGLALPYFAIAWLYLYLRRRGPLQRADAYLLEALRLEPDNATTHAIAAAVAQYRFRYVRAVDSALASAAIDTGAVNADELARSIARRTAGVAMAAYVFCVVSVGLLSAAGLRVTAAVGTALGLASCAAVGWLYREQTRRLPAGVLRLVHRRWELPVALTVSAVLVVLVGVL